ncbi:hypothetical protein L484_010389 [Morus notabilis]|uniref:Uncharacterized protein n=1 Tax=Morus notabilis TaxID=981085 RepID=W9S7I9_9ROSA|nr:hypothetical protein L484_010389 [Morus notabilis]
MGGRAAAAATGIGGKEREILQERERKHQGKMKMKKIGYIRNGTSKDGGLNILQRTGFGLMLFVVAMLVAALVERKRLATSATGSNRFHGS